MVTKSMRAAVMGLLGVVAVGWSLGGADAETLFESLSDVIKNHERIKAAEQDLAAARESAEAAIGD